MTVATPLPHEIKHRHIGDTPCAWPDGYCHQLPTQQRLATLPRLGEWCAEWSGERLHCIAAQTYAEQFGEDSHTAARGLPMFPRVPASQATEAMERCARCLEVLREKGLGPYCPDTACALCEPMR